MKGVDTCSRYVKSKSFLRVDADYIAYQIRLARSTVLFVTHDIDPLRHPASTPQAPVGAFLVLCHRTPDTFTSYTHTASSSAHLPTRNPYLGQR
jgi:hypothetical protein